MKRGIFLSKACLSAKVAKFIGINKNAVTQRLEGAKRYLDLDTGIALEMQNLGLQNADSLHSGWLKSETDLFTL